MNHLDALNSPLVCLGHLSDDSIAVSVYVLVRHGAERQPDLAAALHGRVRTRFADGYSPVRIDFRGDEIEVADEAADSDRAYDLELSGRLGDVSALIATPLAGGLPKPSTRRGRRAIARLADGRVDIDGPLALARNLVIRPRHAATEDRARVRHAGRPDEHDREARSPTGRPPRLSPASCSPEMACRSIGTTP